MKFFTVYISVISYFHHFSEEKKSQYMIKFHFWANQCWSGLGAQNAFSCGFQDLLPFIHGWWIGRNSCMFFQRRKEIKMDMFNNEEFWTWKLFLFLMQNYKYHYHYYSYHYYNSLLLNRWRADIERTANTICKWY